jgi:glycosyltransferase involved in cell wall biosynthesis
MMNRSDIALAPYAVIPNFLASIPSKISEYLSSGLPILCGIEGATGEYLQANRCGWVYRDAAGFAECLTQLLAQPGMISAARLQAGEAFRRDFEANSVVQGAEKALKLVVERYPR